MSQSQVQSKISFANGFNSHHGDRDGICGDNYRKEYSRSGRPGSGNHARGASVGLLYANHAGLNNPISQTGISAKERSEGSILNESCAGSSGQWNLQLTKCLGGQVVEVQLKCGSMYSGVFHNANIENDHVLELKMGRLLKDGSVKGKTDPKKELTARPQKKLLLHAKDVVQIIAKDVPIRGEALHNGRVRENRAEILTDSLLSNMRRGDLERELKPWTPDANDPRDLGLESTFENTQNRNWDQFETNRALFGVESTYNEEIYTTRLDRGPQMVEREREACRIAREIEEENVKSVWTAEERGIRSTKDFELMDEESKFSSVLRPHEDDGEDTEDFTIDSSSDDTFDNSRFNLVGTVAMDDGPHNVIDPERLSTKDANSASVNTHSAAPSSLDNMHKEKLPRVLVGDRSKHAIMVGVFASPRASSLLGDTASLQALNLDPGSPHVSEEVYREFNEFKQQENAKRGKQQREEQVNELRSFSKSFAARQRGGPISGGCHKTASACAPPASALPFPINITNPVSSSGVSTDPLTHGHSVGTDSARIEGVSTSGPQSLRTSTSLALSQSTELCVSPVRSTPTTVPSSPSSEISSSGSSSKKSSLNPNAKEFKLNPHAKSFSPNFTPLRSPSPVIQGLSSSSGVPSNVAPIQTGPLNISNNPQVLQAGQPSAKYTACNNVPVSGASSGAQILPPPQQFMVGQNPIKLPPQSQHPVVGSSFQPVRYAPQSAVINTTSTYMHPNHLYPQQMMYGQSGQFFYYPAFPQGYPMPPPPPSAGPPQQLQTNQRGTMQDVQMCMVPPYMIGQQHYLPPMQMPQLPNSGQPIAGVSNLTTVPPQGGTIPQSMPLSGSSISNSSVMVVGGITGTAATIT